MQGTECYTTPAVDPQFVAVLVSICACWTISSAAPAAVHTDFVSILKAVVADGACVAAPATVHPRLVSILDPVCAGRAQSRTGPATIYTSLVAVAQSIAAGGALRRT